MEYNNIKLLLEKYFDGDTSLLEEQVLRDYFLSDQVAIDLRQYVPIFKSFDLAKKETYQESIELPKKKFHFRYVASAAALVLISFLLWSQSQVKQDSFSTSYENKELAILKTKQAFGVMSKMITNSTTQLEVVEEFDKASSTLFK